jgi:hypothetical protein
MFKILILSLAFTSFAAATETDEFAKNVFQVTLAKDFVAYSKLLHPDCKTKEITEKAFQLRAHLLSKQGSGSKTETLTIQSYRDLKAKTGNPFVDSFTVEPSHYVIVWPQESVESKGTRIDLNPILKTGSGWKLLDGSCITSKKK